MKLHKVLQINEAYKLQIGQKHFNTLFMRAWLGNNTNLTTLYRVLELDTVWTLWFWCLFIECGWFDWLRLSSGWRLAGMLELCNILTNVNFPGFQLGLWGRWRGRQIVQVSHDCVTPGFDPVPVFNNISFFRLCFSGVMMMMMMEADRMTRINLPGIDWWYKYDHLSSQESELTGSADMCCFEVSKHASRPPLFGWTDPISCIWFSQRCFISQCFLHLL